MNTIRILLLNLGPSPELAAALRAILESAPGPAIELREESHPELTGGDGDLGALAAQVRADAVFLVLPSDPRADSWPRELAPDGLAVPVFAVCPHGSPADVLDLLDLGFTDFILGPLRAGDVVARLRRALDHRPPAPRSEPDLTEQQGLRQLVGRSPLFVRQLEKIPCVARCDAGVLICGETGTGKELVARAIHYLSPRSKKPFVPVDCGALPVDLVENELFGHERAAYTGASSAQSGLIEEADGGTLFLDEIDNLPPLAQVKLLRFLQEKKYRRLGSTRTRSSDLRVIAATNVEVERAVAEGRLRRDLYYRLNVVSLLLPPLRERREDIPLLVGHFVRRYNRQLGRSVRGFSPGALEALMRHDWPGNVRELEHVVEGILVLCENRALVRSQDVPLPSGARTSRRRSFREAKAQVVARFERRYLEETLAVHQGNISRAARAASKNRRAFWELLRKHRIDAERFKAATSYMKAG